MGGGAIGWRLGFEISRAILVGKTRRLGVFFQISESFYRV
jgi:hypothetical protein